MEILWLQEMGTQNHIQLQSKGKSKLKTSQTLWKKNEIGGLYSHQFFFLKSDIWIISFLLPFWGAVTFTI